MAVYTGPKYGSTDFDASRWRDLYAAFIGTGVVKGARVQGAAGGDLAASATTGLGWSVATGEAVVKGFACIVDTAAATGTLAAADPTLPRIDTIILSWTYSAGVPTLSVTAVTGTPASSPVAPTLTQNDTTYQLALADCLVNAAATTIASVTDRRTYAAPVTHAVSHATGGSDPITPASIGAAAITGAAFSGDVSTTGNVIMSGYTLFGAAVSGGQSQLFYNSGLNTTTLNTPQAGAAAKGIGFGTWDGAASHNPFSIGGQFLGALSWVDNSGRFHDNAGLVVVEGANNAITPFKIGGGTALPGTLGSREVFILLA